MVTINASLRQRIRESAPAKAQTYFIGRYKGTGNDDVYVRQNGVVQANRCWIHDPVRKVEYTAWNTNTSYVRGLPVEVIYDAQLRQYRVTGVAPVDGTQALGEGVKAFNRPEAPAELIREVVNSKRLAPFRLSIVSGLQVRIASGWYVYNASVRYFAPNNITLSAAGITSGYHLYQIIVLDVSDGTLSTRNSAERLASAPLTVDLIADIAFDSTEVPLWAVDLNSTSTTFSFFKECRDLRGFINTSSSLSLNDLTDVDISSAADGDVLYYNNTDSEWQNAPLLDSNQQVPTASIANDAVTSDKLATNSVTSDAIAAGAVDTAELANDAVTDDKLNDSGVSAGSYTAADVTVNAQGRVTAATANTLGTIASQDANNVSITGGTIDGTTIGGTTPELATFTAIDVDAGGTGTTDVNAGSLVLRNTASNPSFQMFIDATGNGMLFLVESTSGGDFRIAKFVNGSFNRFVLNLDYASPYALKPGATGGNAQPLGGTGTSERWAGLYSKDAIYLYNTTAPAAIAGGLLYAVSGELIGQDSAGNTTTLTSHNPELFDTSGRETAVIHKEWNAYTGTQIEIDWVGAIQEIEATSSKQFIRTRSLAPHKKKNPMLRRKYELRERMQS